jgi:anti-sigma-K factor RskA
MDHKTEFEDQIALFALGLLTGYELRKIEEHLETGCKICNALLKDSEAVFTNLPYVLKDSPLSPELEDRIMEKLDNFEERHNTQDKSFLHGFWKGLSPMWLNLGSAVAAAAIIFLFISTLTLQNRLSLQEKNMEVLLATLEKDKEMMDYVKNPDVSVINLAGTMSELGSSGRLLWDTDTNDALLLVSNVPELVPGQTYQFWVLKDGKPHSMGTFTVNQKGDSMMEIHSMPEEKGRIEFSVTLEPEGGMPEPTGTTYLVGSL